MDRDFPVTISTGGMGLYVTTPKVLKEDKRRAFSDHPGKHRYREGIKRGDISMEYIEIQYQITDIFTKALGAVIFIKFRDMLVVSVLPLNLMVKKSKEPEAKKSEEHAVKKQKK